MTRDSLMIPPKTRPASCPSPDADKFRDVLLIGFPEEPVKPKTHKHRWMGVVVDIKQMNIEVAEYHRNGSDSSTAADAPLISKPYDSSATSSESIQLCDTPLTRFIGPLKHQRVRPVFGYLPTSGTMRREKLYFTVFFNTETKFHDKYQVSTDRPIPWILEKLRNNVKFNSQPYINKEAREVVMRFRMALDFITERRNFWENNTTNNNRKKYAATYNVWVELLEKHHHFVAVSYAFFLRRYRNSPASFAEYECELLNKMIKIKSS